jgi:hypothetical protein
MKVVSALVLATAASTVRADAPLVDLLVCTESL